MAVSLQEGKGVVSLDPELAMRPCNKPTEDHLHIPDFALKNGALTSTTLRPGSTCAVVAALEGPNVYTDNS